MDRIDAQTQRSLAKQLRSAFFFCRDVCIAVQIRCDQRTRRGPDLLQRSFRDDRSALCARTRSHFDHPVRFLQHLSIVIHQHDRIAVVDQIAHDLFQPDDVGRMQTDRRFIQHVEHTAGAVAYGTGQLHALTLSGGQRRTAAIERQVSKSQLQQPLCIGQKGAQMLSASSRICGGSCFGTSFTHSLSCISGS